MGKKVKIIKWMALCMPLLLASCGAKKAVVADKVDAESVQLQNDVVGKRTFVQRVNENRVYAKNITGKMSFSIQMGDKEISAPGAVRMRRDEVIRLQVFVPILGTEVGRLEFTPDYVLIVDRWHKEYIKADYSQVDFLQKQGITFYSLQALFWNELTKPGSKSVTDADLGMYDADLSVVGDAVPVTYKNGNMDYTWTADRMSGRISQTSVAYRSTKNGTASLDMKYSNFKNVGVKQFPATQVLTLFTDATAKRQEVRLTIDMDEVKTDEKWETRTEVPAKYKQMSSKDVLGKILNMQ